MKLLLSQPVNAYRSIRISRLSTICDGVYPLLFVFAFSDDISGIYCNESIKWENTGDGGDECGIAYNFHSPKCNTQYQKDRGRKRSCENREIWIFNTSPKPVKYQVIKPAMGNGDYGNIKWVTSKVKDPIFELNMNFNLKTLYMPVVTQGTRRTLLSFEIFHCGKQ